MPSTVRAIFIRRICWLAAFSRSRVHNATTTRIFAQVRAIVFRLATSRRRDPWIALILASALAGLAAAYGTRDVGGADEYGYVSQADLWLKGQLKIDQSFVSAAPWPRAASTFAPLGYRPDPLDKRLLVPVYSPGLPIALALAKALAGQTAMFFVVPLAGFLLVIGTYRLGARLASRAAALVGAWLVATSPVVLVISMGPMSDVPVAAAWTWAMYFLFGRGLGSAAAAGLLSGVAVLIRPNLVPLAGVLGLYYVWMARHTATRGRSLQRAFVFAAAAAPFVVGVGLLNWYLFGSPTESGYGHLQNLFSWSRIPTNVRHYAGWLIETHTPVPLLGVCALLVPLRRFWPGLADRSGLAFTAAFAVMLWTIYCAWDVFDAWWFCRFLLSSWPLIMIGTGGVFVALARVGGRLVSAALVTLVVGIGAFQIWFAQTHGMFLTGRKSSHYAIAGHLVRDVTPQNGVVFSWNHSGSIRYYGGRMTINIQNFEGGLDEMVEWLNSHHAHAYAAFDEWELRLFRQRFPGARSLDALSAPVAILEDDGKFLVFDLSQRGPASRPIVVTGSRAGWRAPGPAPSVAFELESGG